MSRERRYTAMLAFAALIWGIGFVAQRAAMDHMGPFTFNWIRFGLGGLSLIPVVLMIEKKDGFNKTTLIAGLTCGIVLFVAAALQQWGVATTGSAAKSGFITGLYIVLTPILGMLVGRKTTKYVWFGAVLATAGLYFIANPGALGLDFGVIALLGGAFAWSVHILVIDRFVGRIKPLGFSVVQCLVCSVLSLGAAFSFENIQMSQITAGYIPVLYSALVSVCIAYTLQVIGQRYVAPAKSAIIFSLESVFGAAGEAVILGTFLDIRGYLGGVLIFAGIIASQLRMIHKNENEPKKGAA